jgi:C1A family cysteine protease
MHGAATPSSREAKVKKRSERRQVQPTFGWIPDVPDRRDLLYSAPIDTLRVLPTNVDLRPNCPPIYNQQSLQSCSAQAVAAAIMFDELKQGIQPALDPSRLFIYYNARALEPGDEVDYDRGAQIRDCMKSVANQGYCSETCWSYDGTPWAANTKFKTKPLDSCYQEATQHNVANYQSIVNSLSQMEGCLAEGFPFAFGFVVYESFAGERTKRTGVVQLPAGGEARIGKHVVLAVGYNRAAQQFIIRNSSGDSWGKGGYGFMPYAYLLDGDLSANFWTIRLVK